VSRNPDPLSIEIVEIKLIKYRTSSGGFAPEYINILPQMVQFELYQSIFQPLLRAQLTIVDTIGLRSLFPLLGEETVRVSFIDTRQLRQVEERKDEPPTNLEFVVINTDAVLFDDTGKVTAYSIDLVSREEFTNSKTKIQKAYHDTYTDIIKSVVRDEIGLQSTKPIYGLNSTLTPEQTKGKFHLIIPNMHPLQSINWMCDRAVSADPANFYFTFFEKFNSEAAGFYFTTIQSMIKEGKRRLFNSINTGTFKWFVYASNYNSSIAEITRQRLNLPDTEPVSTKFITNLGISKRFATVEKILSGFYENEYTEIDIWNSQIRQHRTIADTRRQLSRRLVRDGINPEHLALSATGTTTDRHQINTPFFVADIVTQNNLVSPARQITKVRLGLGDRPDPDQEDFWPSKIGESLRIKSAFSQFGITFTLPGDTRVQAGDIIRVDIPLSSGFTKNPDSIDTNLDPLLTGFYLITDIKHSVYNNNRYSMVINANKESFNQPLYIPGTELPNISAYHADSEVIPRDV
jgi:hypothetical protein